MSQYQASRPCVVCNNSTSITHYCHLDNLDYVRCNTCGLIYVDKYAVDQDMYKAYTGGGLKSLRRKLMAPLRKMHHIKGYKHFSARANEIFSFANRFAAAASKKTYLDIGCNKGFLLAEAARMDYDVHGVELVTELVRPFCNTFPAFSSQVYSDKFSKVARNFSDGFFSLITAIDVVEHFEDPLQDMQNICRILDDRGAFVIQTPDINCQQAKELGCNWGALKPLEHLNLFGAENFTSFARHAGFSQVEIFPAFEEADGNFVAVLKK